MNRLFLLTLFSTSAKKGAKEKEKCFFKYIIQSISKTDEIESYQLKLEK